MLYVVTVYYNNIGNLLIGKMEPHLKISVLQIFFLVPIIELFSLDYFSKSQSHNSINTHGLLRFIS